jgi:hypothetical protein
MIRSNHFRLYAALAAAGLVAGLLVILGISPTISEASPNPRNADAPVSATSDVGAPGPLLTMAPSS